jgi:hypothetical protein
LLGVAINCTENSIFQVLYAIPTGELTGAHGAMTWQVDEQVSLGEERKKVEAGNKNEKKRKNNLGKNMKKKK